MRVGEHFVTRVAFLTDPPLPEVDIGDPVWDQHVVTRAGSAQEAHYAFPPRLRALLQTWGFQGHIEMRPGGAVVHYAGLKPVPAHYEQLTQVIPQLITAAFG